MKYSMFVAMRSQCELGNNAKYFTTILCATNRHRSKINTDVELIKLSLHRINPEGVKVV